jgi:hypothetical protein
VVESVVDRHRYELEAAWAIAEHAASAAELSERLKPILRHTAREVLVRLYPQSAAIFDAR